MRTELVVFIVIPVSIFFGICVFIGLYRARGWTITIPFDNKEEFMKKLNMFLFQMRFKLESNKEYFFVYKMGMFSGGYRIAVTLNEKEATIVGPKLLIEKLEKAILEK